MKIVHVEDFFHPEAGYQVNVLSRLQRRVGHEVTVVTAELEKIPPFLVNFFGKGEIAAKDKMFVRDSGVKIVRVPLLGFISGRAIFSPFLLFKRIRELNPDVVLVHNLDTFTGMLFTLLSSWLSYPIVFDSHMLEMASNNPMRWFFRIIYRWIFAPIILRHEIPVIRVQNSDYVEKCLGIPLAHTELIPLGTDTHYFVPDASARQSTRGGYCISNSAFLVLYAGKLDEAKGGRFLAESIREKFKSEGNREVEFLIVGNVVGQDGEGIERLFLSSQNKVVRLPTQRYRDLAQIYQAADIAVFPRQCSLSFFDAQSCGLPVLFEDNEINRQRAMDHNALLFSPGSVADFRAKVEWMMSLSSKELDTIRSNARNYVVRNYDYSEISRGITMVLERTVLVWRQRKRR